MSNNNFVKGECRQCGGHLEFPANAAGETIECPHCGRPTALVAFVSPNKTNASRRKWLAAAVVAVVVSTGVTAAFFWVQKAGRGAISETQSAPAALTNTSAVPATTRVAPAEVTDEEHTNDFAISPIKLEKTAGSSLVYVTGRIRNLTSRQRFGVKVEFDLFDTNGLPVGKATDYQAVLEPDGEWRFKALVMDSKAVAARFNSILEDQQ